MNKKAQGFWIMNWLFRVAIIVVIATTLFIILTSHFNSSLNSREVENYILIKRMIYSPNILAYRDTVTGRVYHGTIDLKKFDTDRIDYALNNENKRMAVNLHLTNLETEEIKQAYINEQRAKAWDDYVVIGGFDETKINRFVKIYDNGKIYPGLLRMKVLVRK